jgi:hypothetical protein
MITGTMLRDKNPGMREVFWAILNGALSVFVI